MKKKDNFAQQYVVCIDNEGYKASLEKGKLYRTLPDTAAASHGYLRVIDESGEDYGYSAKRFFPMKLPVVLEKTLFDGEENSAIRSSLKKSPRPKRSSNKLYV